MKTFLDTHRTISLSCTVFSVNWRTYTSPKQGSKLKGSI